MRGQKRNLMVLLLVFCFTFVWIGSVPAQELKIGQRAPRFELPELVGDSTYFSADIFPENELTVLILWTSYCPDCWKALKSCRDLDTTLAKSDVAVIGINFDTEKLATVRGFIKGEKIDFVNLSDFEKKIALAYKAEAYDFSTFIIDTQGTIQYVSYDHPPDVDKVIIQEVERILEMKKKESSESKDKPKEPEESKGRKNRKI